MVQSVFARYVDHGSVLLDRGLERLLKGLAQVLMDVPWEHHQALEAGDLGDLGHLGVLLARLRLLLGTGVVDRMPEVADEQLRYLEPVV